MVLLTSSQVSVAISSVIVLSFTSALFLSGYVLQQATVRDLRAAIKPQMIRPLPELQVNMPPHFRDKVDQQGVAEVMRVEVTEFTQAGKELRSETTETENDVKHTKDSERMSADSGGEDDMVGATRWQKAQRRKEEFLAKQQEAQELVSNNQAPEENQMKSSDSEDALGKAGNEEEKPLSRAARRKKIKEEAMAAGQGEDVTGYRRRKWT